MKLALIILTLTFANNVIASNECNITNPDPKGYLQVICKHIVENNISVSPAKPNEYQIRKIAGTIYNENPALLIHLSCCNNGDIAIIKPETMEVLEFNVGKK